MNWIKEIINGGQSSTFPTWTNSISSRPRGSANSVWSAWSSWTDCTKCSGKRIRTRLCDPAANCGGGDGYQEENCSKQPECASKSGQWSDWSTWSTCSTSCKGGIRRRTRFCLIGKCFDTAIDIEVSNSNLCNFNNDAKCYDQIVAPKAGSSLIERSLWMISELLSIIGTKI